MNKPIIDSKINIPDIKKISKNPNILIAAGFWEKERYEAALVCYRFMRRIDDLIDNRKAMGTNIDECEQKALESEVLDWIDCVSGKKGANRKFEEIRSVIEDFSIPLVLFHNFAKAMIYDIRNSGFPSYPEFEKYAEGASVAPAAIFVHLCCLNHDRSAYVLPGMKLQEVSRPCALFSYIVHIIRDFQKDFEENLVYFARDRMEEFGVGVHDLYEASREIHVSPGFRKLIKWYLQKADEYKWQTYRIIDKMAPHLQPEYLMSLQVIFELYLMVYERIDYQKGKFTTTELNPGTQELIARVEKLMDVHFV